MLEQYYFEIYSLLYYSILLKLEVTRWAEKSLGLTERSHYKQEAYILFLDKICVKYVKTRSAKNR